MESWSLLEAIEEHGFDFRGELALSVATMPGLTANEIALDDRSKFLTQGKMRVTTVGALRSAGYEVVEDDEPHALVLLPQKPDEAMLEELRAIFAETRDNPRRKKGTGQ
jgi:hypothetical protein